MVNKLILSKNLILALSLVIIFTLFRNPLIYSQQNYNLGFRTSLVFSNQIWTSKEENNSWSGNYIVGFSLGLFYKLNISKIFDIQTEINFSKNGSYLPSSLNEFYVVDNEKKNAKVILNYLSFIALANVKVKNSKYIPYLIIGPKLDVLVKKEIFMSSVTDANMNSFDYGLCIGVGSDFLNFKKFQLTFELRYNQGFNKINSIISRTDILSIKNRSIELGIKLGLKY